MAIVAGLELEEEEIHKFLLHAVALGWGGGDGRSRSQKALSWIISHIFGDLGVVLFGVLDGVFAGVLGAALGPRLLEDLAVPVLGSQPTRFFILGAPMGTRGTLGPAHTKGPRDARHLQRTRTSSRPRGTRGPAPTEGPRGARSWQLTRMSVRSRGSPGPAPTGGPRGARL